MYKLTGICEDHGIPVAGIIDSDYYGNTEQVCEIPVIDSELAFSDPEKLDYYKNNFNFFCATNWIPESTPVDLRNRQKRSHLIDLIESLGLNCISLVDRDARILKYAEIGRGVFLDAHVMIEVKSKVGDFVSIYYNTLIGHDNVIGKNSVFQRQCILTGNNIVEEDVFFGVAVKALKPGAVFKRNSFIHEGIYIRRGTVADEVVSMNSINQSRVIYQYVD
jgi:NDP-sugar pyrophosphorylase family protein